MCGGFVGDILDGVGDILEDVGDFVGDTVDAVVHNPVGVLTNVALLYMGVPPVYAGAIAGGVNAAATGGDVLKGALTGGAMAGAAGYAGEWAQASGVSTVGQAAAMGAAAGATGAALTGQGLQHVVRGALSGGVMGGALGYIQKSNGSITYTYDDGSTLTRNPDGSYSSTPSGSIPAPVVDRSTYSTDKVNLSSSWPIKVDAAPGTVWTGASGPEIVLDGGKVLPLDVYRAAVALDKPIFVDGVAVSPQYADIATAGQGNYYDQSNINQLYRTPNTVLATAEQINTGDAYYNPQARAWESMTVTSANADSQYIPRSLTSTGISDSAPGTIFQGPNGAEIVLDSGKTVNLAEYNAAAAEGRPFTVDNQWQMQFKVEVSGGIPKYEGDPRGTGTPPEGYRVARPEDVFGPDDSRNAQNPFKSGTYIDRETNTWFTPIDTPTLTPVPLEPVAPGNITPSTPETPQTTYNPNAPAGPGPGVEITQPIQPVEITPTPNIPTVQPGGQTTVFDDGTWLTVMPDGSSSGIDTNGQPFARGPGTLTPGAGPGTGPTYTYDDGSTMTINPDGSITTRDIDGNTSTRTPAGGPSGPGTGTGGTDTGGPVAPPADTTVPVDETEFPHDRGEPAPGDDTTTPTTPTEPTTPTSPIVPIVPVTPTPTTPAEPGYTLNWGKGPIPTLVTNAGLNPGWIQPVAQYQTTSPVQSQFFWGAAPFQQGPTFNPQLAAQGIGAPATPWGLQQMYQQLTPAQTAALVASSPYLSQLPGAQVAGPVAPT